MPTPSGSYTPSPAPSTTVGPAPISQPPYDGPPLLLPKSKTTVGVYAGIGTAYTRMLHRDGAVVSLEAALLLEHHLSIGLAGYVFSRTPSGPVGPEGEPRQFGATYGGLTLRYAWYARDFPIYASFGVLLGGGALGLVDEQTDYDHYDDYDHHHDHWGDGSYEAFFVAQPELFVHANVTRWMRFGVGGGYRFATAVSRWDYDAKHMGGAVAGANLQFGWL